MLLLKLLLQPHKELSNLLWREQISFIRSRSRFVTVSNSITDYLLFLYKTVTTPRLTPCITCKKIISAPSIALPTSTAGWLALRLTERRRFTASTWGGQLSDKAINGLGVESLFMKNAIEKTSQGFTGGYFNGFFNEVMLGSGDVKTAAKKGFVQGGWGAAFGFTFSSAEYGLNRAGVEQYWTSKELSLKIKGPFDDYYEYHFKYENGSQPNSPYYQYNPRLTPNGTPGNNWQVPMRAPTPAPYNPLNLWKTIYPELYYP